MGVWRETKDGGPGTGIWGVGCGVGGKGGRLLVRRGGGKCRCSVTAASKTLLPAEQDGDEVQDKAEIRNVTNCEHYNEETLQL